MSEYIPSQNEDPLCKCKALYLGTSLFNTSNKKYNESALNLSQLQDTIAERYPTDGSNFAKGIQTFLSIYPSGIQMEHSSSKDTCSISALFYYPIKSLVYCGALRLIKNSNYSDSKSWKFVPLDTELAQKNENFKNPPLFVVFVKGIDPSTKKQVVECLVFVVGMVKIAMKLIESCQKAFNSTRETTTDFYKKFGNIPVVYCMKNDLNDINKRVLVKKFDKNGYYYATENTPIDIWQLFEENENLYETMTKGKYNKSINNYEKTSNKQDEQIYSEVRHKRNDNVSKKSDVIELTPPKVNKGNEENNKTSVINPYEKSENLIKVEKRVDPVTGQNIYVRYLTDNSNKPKTYDLPDQVYDSESNEEQNCDSDEEVKKAPIIIRQEKTPSPIIVEKYIKKRAPQVIIKEIHVHEPAPPPVKIIQNMENQFGGPNPPDTSYKRPPNVLGPNFSSNTLPRPSNTPSVRVINSNPVSLNENHLPGFSDARNLLNKAYGYPGFEYNIDSKYSSSQYPVYTSLNRNHSRRNYDINYCNSGMSNIYDYNLKPRKLFNDVTVNPREYSSLKHQDVKRYSSCPKNEYYRSRVPSNRRIYTDQSRQVLPEDVSYRSRHQFSDVHDLNKPKVYHRNQSSGRLETRRTYNY